MRSESNGELTAKLERALVLELMSEWRRVNGAHFRDALAPATILLSSSTAHLGLWIPAARAIELQRAMILSQPWPVVVEVLKHEMAHQYAHEVLGAIEERAHGPAFRGVCERLGIDPAASGLPTIGRVHDDATTKAVERIARLLALAESPNVHEAEAAMAAAQRLMLKHNIDAQTRALVHDYGHRAVGAPSGRVEESQRILAGLLGKHFFVEVIWVPAYRPLEGRRGSILEICGTRANLDMAEYVHAFLTRTLASTWADHKKMHGVRSNRERRTFQSGVISGFGSKLARETKRHHEEGLVWVKDAAVDTFFRKRHPHVRNIRYGGSPRSDAWHKGREVGEKIVLRRGVGEGEPAVVSRGRLLR